MGSRLKSPVMIVGVQEILLCAQLCMDSITASLSGLGVMFVVLFFLRQVTGQYTARMSRAV